MLVGSFFLLLHKNDINVLNFLLPNFSQKTKQNGQKEEKAGSKIKI